LFGDLPAPAMEDGATYTTGDASSSAWERFLELIKNRH
jgi:hypothetical protein